MLSGWTKGTWKVKGDTVLFQMVPAYDTLTKGAHDKLTDSLILSAGEIPERISTDPNTITSLSSGGQNTVGYPDKLLFRKGRLYKIINGKLLTKKQIGFGSKKKWAAWYFKSVD